MNILNLIYVVLIIYGLIGLGTSLIIANYQDDLAKVREANGEMPRHSSIMHLIIGNIIFILMWPLMIYAACTWWQKSNNNA
jgi:hypothetical protein